MTDDLVQWLRAQLDEDAAGAADPHAEKAWHARHCEALPDVLYPDRETGACDCGVPARVLREVEAKRQLIARGGPFCTSNCDAPGNEPMDPDTNWTTPLEHHLDCAAYQAAGVLSLPYADRPDYRGEWRP